MKGAPRPSFHPPDLLRPTAVAPAEDEAKFFDRPCYEFNRLLAQAWNDKYCEHCRHYLTARCPHIDEFLDDVEDLSPE
ncbi:MAG: hypothetical protein ACLQC7_08155 [Thermoplasmata archaeon]